MDRNSTIALVIVFLLVVVGIWLRIRVFNSSDGERYLKQRMQGPFVPVDESEEKKPQASAKPEL
ncbi:hypothetical protein [Undibacterium sp.]|jgi:hypothetical protein|uniref:hypothetical protein n=1 Tax=Undibacterium sp. TaxID=1914977 RepID=UPI002B73B48F|nr:hypothetical protein [Undibacterium sp.]HTD03431.1 hypothetical protein [Undibacterium sp.]